MTIRRYNRDMTKLTMDQIRQLNMYSVYLDTPERKLFTLETLLDPSLSEDALVAVQAISNCPNKTVAASYFLRRIGMFVSMQFYNLATYDQIWIGTPDRLIFGAKEEFGNLAVSTFVHSDDWQYVEEKERRIIMKQILTEQCDAVIQQIRTVANISSRTLWENIFGFLLWHYHVLLENPSTSEESRADLDMLKNAALWEGIASHSLFAAYLKGNEPSALLNTTVRTTCCLSKDVPGLMQCGFCPLK